jgi:hypothetical protein
LDDLSGTIDRSMFRKSGGAMIPDSAMRRRDALTGTECWRIRATLAPEAASQLNCEAGAVDQTNPHAT